MHLVPDGLVPDKQAREAVDNHLREWARRRNEPATPETKEDEGSNRVFVDGTTVANNSIDNPTAKETTTDSSNIEIPSKQEEKDNKSHDGEIMADNAEDAVQSSQIQKLKPELVGEFIYSSNKK